MVSIRFFGGDGDFEFVAGYFASEFFFQAGDNAGSSVQITEWLVFLVAI